MKTMQETMKYLCENIQGCVFGYTQSDEITLILKDYKTFETDAWFDYEVQKICSISASMATMAFNKYFSWNIEQDYSEYKSSMIPQSMNFQMEKNLYYNTLRAAAVKGAMFDARCFNIPREEVANLIYWRQLDAVRNSIQMVGQANFSHKELQNKSCNMIQDMLFTEKGINWNDFPIDCKRGSCCVKNYYDTYGEHLVYTGKLGEWVIDQYIPIFKGEARFYIEKFLLADEEKDDVLKRMEVV